MSDINYAVHTRTCTYLLDEEGVCKWIVSPTGMVPPDVRRCVGAQFVACLDLRLPGGLAGELRIGGAALFIGRDEASGRSVLLRTTTIENVEFRSGADPLPTHAPAYEAPRITTREEAERPEMAKFAPFDAEETSVTLTIPLYRPEAQLPSRPRRAPR